ncbi:MAG: DNA cytosine methyltransferase [Erythrobacter sp.]|nr:DNA cytosine methyltransferase [Erythrobacter sp.]
MRSIELFVGAGGLGIGASQAGFRPAAVIDWDKWACDTIRRNQDRNLAPMNEWPLFEADVSKFDFRSVADTVDLVTGGPPCQPFSLGGQHRAFLDKRDMFPQAIRAVRELRPRAFVFENVKGLTRTTFANYLEYIRLQLRHPDLLERKSEPWMDHLARLEDHETRGRHDGLHYHVVMRVLNAADYGVPQRRERVFIVGFRADLGVEWHFPEPTHTQEALLWSQWRSNLYWDLHRVAQKHRPQVSDATLRAAAKLRSIPQAEPWRTVRDAISDLPDPELQTGRASRYHDHRLQPGARSYPGHTGSPLDEPAKTLKAGVHGVPGGENMLRRPDGSVRYFTIRESARLQTFPDDMVFHGSWTEVMRQLGNAVPCGLAAAVATQVRDCLTRISSPAHTFGEGLDQQGLGSIRRSAVQ